MGVGIERHLPGAAVGSSCVDTRVPLCVSGLPWPRRANRNFGRSREELEALHNHPMRGSFVATQQSLVDRCKALAAQLEGGDNPRVEVSKKNR